MARFVDEANERISQTARGETDRFRTSAWISHRFVAIHPYPDFNGRSCRLLVNLVLYRFGVPFPVVLRGDKIGKRRYIESLRRADRGEPAAYAASIAMTVARSFEKLDESFVRAGLRPLIESPGGR